MSCYAPPAILLIPRYYESEGVAARCWVIHHHSMLYCALPYKNASRGRRKVIGSLKITHEAWKKTKDKETKRDKVPAELREQFQAAMKTNDQIEPHLAKARPMHRDAIAKGLIVISTR